MLRVIMLAVSVTLVFVGLIVLGAVAVLYIAVTHGPLWVGAILLLLGGVIMFVCSYLDRRKPRPSPTVRKTAKPRDPDDWGNRGF